MLDKAIKIGILFDFYGELLTEKQQNAIELYYFQDLSLSEIAERLEISRQGVYDHLNRGEEILNDYEHRLGLVAKYELLKNEIEELNEYIKGKSLHYSIKSDLEKRINRIKERL
ncbi:YlxM family DNA-binding protein [Natronospora cellulosivora (SeqCode)]